MLIIGFRVFCFSEWNTGTFMIEKMCKYSPYKLITTVAFHLTNLNPDSAIENLIFISFRDKPMSDYNLIDPRPKVDRWDWYLNLISDFAFHLASYFQIIARGNSEHTNKQRPFAGRHGDDKRNGSIVFRIFVPANIKIQTI